MVSGDFDFDFFRLGFFALRQMNLKHTVLELSAHFVGVGNNKTPHKSAIGALNAVILLVLLFLELAFANDGQQAVLHRDLCTSARCWTDVDLSPRGYEEAIEAGELLKSYGYSFECAFTVLTRAIRTLWIVLDELNLIWIPVFKSWRLNERHHGLARPEKAERLTLPTGESS